MRAAQVRLRTSCLSILAYGASSRLGWLSCCLGQTHGVVPSGDKLEAGMLLWWVQAVLMYPG